MEREGQAPSTPNPNDNRIARERMFWRVLTRDSFDPVWLPVLYAGEKPSCAILRFSEYFPLRHIVLVEKRSIFGGPLVPESQRRFN